MTAPSSLSYQAARLPKRGAPIIHFCNKVLFSFISFVFHIGQIFDIDICAAHRVANRFCVFGHIFADDDFLDDARFFGEDRNFRVFGNCKFAFF